MEEAEYGTHGPSRAPGAARRETHFGATPGNRPFETSVSTGTKAAGTVDRTGVQRRHLPA